LAIPLALLAACRLPPAILIRVRAGWYSIGIIDSVGKEPPMKSLMFTAVLAVLSSAVFAQKPADAVAVEKEIRQRTESVSLDNVKVRMYGDAAVLTADRTTKSTLRGQDNSGRQREIRVFVERNGRWQAVAMQTTPLR
jgi:hypothetical protein